jgi:hypothetical protein
MRQDFSWFDTYIEWVVYGCAAVYNISALAIVAGLSIVFLIFAAPLAIIGVLAKRWMD